MGEIRLEPPPTWMNGYCTKAARVLGYSVLCPTELPHVRILFPCRGRAPGNELWDERDCHEYVLDGLFEGPPSYRGLLGRSTGRGHRIGHFALWTIHEGDAFDTGGLFGCPGGGRRRGAASLSGIDGSWWICPAGRSANLNSGHIAFQWRRGAIVYGVSVHGISATNRRLVESLVRAIRLVAPNGSCQQTSELCPRPIHSELCR